MENESHVAINSAVDIVTARQKGRALAQKLGFDGSDLTLIATAISEVARTRLRRFLNRSTALSIVRFEAWSS